MSKEIWKSVEGYEGLYEVSNLGNVNSLSYNNGRMLKAFINGPNYLGVTLYKNQNPKRMYIHTLVAITFLDHTPDGYNLVVDHKNNVRTDNRVENLQIVTNRQNISKDMKNGSSNYTGVSWNKSSSKWRAYIYISGKQKHLGLFTTQQEASEVYQAKLTTL